MKRDMELQDYIKENVEDFSARADYARTRIDMERVPLYIADAVLYEEISDAIMEWCDDWDEDCSAYDPEDYV